MSEYDLDNNEYGGENQEATHSMMSTGSEEESREKLKKLVKMILGMGDSRHLEKICCFFRINKRSSLTRQLTLEFSILLTIFMIVIVSCFVFYARFSPNYISDTILNLVDTNIEDTLQNSILEFSSQVHLQLRSYSSWLIIFSQLFSNAAGWNSTLYDSPSQILLKPNKRYYRYDEPVPADLVNSKYSYSSNFDYVVTLKTFQYLAYHPDDQGASLSADSISILDSLDILSYQFQNFFYDPSLSFVQSLYIYLEDRQLFCAFPGGMMTERNMSGYVPSSRPWYKQVQSTFAANSGLPIPSLTGPYIAYNTKQFIITVSMPIMKVGSPSVISAVMNVDINLSNFKSIYDSSLLSLETMTMAFIELQSEIILNDCFKQSTPTRFFDTNVTGFTQQNWDEILNFDMHQVNTTFQIRDFYNNSYYVSRAKIQNIFASNDSNFLLIAFGRQSEYLTYRNEIQALLDSRIFSFSVTLLICFGIIWFLGYFYVYFLSRSIAYPITQLSNLAKGINKNEGKKDSTESMKQQLSKVKFADANTKKLIESFLNLVNQHSGMRKIQLATNYVDGTSTPAPSYCHSADFKPYPKNDYQEQLDDIKYEIALLKNMGNSHSDQQTDNSGGGTISHRQQNPRRFDDDDPNDRNSYSSMPSARGFSEKEPSLMDDNVTELNEKRIQAINQIQTQIQELGDNEAARLLYSKKLLSLILPSNSQII